MIIVLIPQHAWLGLGLADSPMGQGSGARQGDHPLQEVTVQAVPHDTSHGRSTSGRVMPLHLMGGGKERMSQGGGSVHSLDWSHAAVSWVSR